MKKILVVEDNEDLRILYKRLFRKTEDIQIEDVDSGEKALERAAQSTPDLMIIDISLPGITGLDLTEQIRQKYPSVKIMIVTGHEVSRYQKEAIKRGANDLVSKEIGRDIVNRCIDLINQG
ncbi:Two-component response regulator yesN [Chitinispirillum alkaliphilum]|nr:Two-component response regulator yesN [Chitinispirillum alkaliphilum]